MLVIVEKQGAGKTAQPIGWLQESPPGECRVLVSHTSEAAMRKLAWARERGLKVGSWQFVGVDEILRPGVLLGVVKSGDRIVLAVDDLDIVLPMLLKFPVGAVSALG